MGLIKHKLFLLFVLAFFTLLTSFVTAQEITFETPSEGQLVSPEEIIRVRARAIDLVQPTKVVINSEGDGMSMFGVDPIDDEIVVVIDWLIPGSAMVDEEYTVTITVSQNGRPPLVGTRTVIIRDTTPPDNDNLADAVDITGISPRTLMDSNINATAETNENAHGNTSWTTSVWYEWTPTITGSAKINTFGSDFDSMLGVYTGDTFPLSQVAFNNDFDRPNGELNSQVTFQADQGEVYKIAVIGFENDSGSIQLNWSLATEGNAAWIFY